MQKKSQKWGALALLALALVFAGCENATGGVSYEEVQEAIGNMPFVNTDPGLRTLDDALAYVSKWVWRYDVSETDQRLYFNNYYVTFTPTRFSFSANIVGIPAGSYPYTLARDGDDYILKIADWTQGVPGGSLKAIARIAYDPDNLTMVFTNPTDDDEYDWSVDGDTFLPDLTEYYASSSFASSSYVYTEDNIPATAANKVGTISFNASGSLVTTNASEVFAAAVNNKPDGIAWAVVGKDRKLIGGSFTDMGSLSVDPEKPLVTIGDKKFAQRIALCGFICSYYEVDCCPYINGNWLAVDADNEPLAGANAAYFTIQAGAGWMKLKKTGDDESAVDTDVYGAGLAGLSATANNAAYGINITGDLTIYDQATNLPLLTFVNLDDVDSQKEGNTSTNPNPRIITFKPAGKTTEIRLKK